jgi:DNA-binding XRE family transcriptional regulator
MFVKSDRKKEERIIDELVLSDPQLKLQHELFLEEMRFKEVLIEARLKEQLTQADISSRSGLSQQAVSRLERGNGANLDTIIRYLSSMGYSLSIKKNTSKSC